VDTTAHIGIITSIVNGKIAATNNPKHRLNYRIMELQGILARINYRLEKLGLNKTAASRLAERPDAIRNIERAIKNGGRRGVSTDTIAELARVLDVSVEWLMTGVGLETATPATSMTLVPLISWVSAGKFESVCDVEHPGEVLQIPVAGLPKGDWIALEVTGDSMDRLSPPGSRILINRRETELCSGGCYVVITEQGEATYKRYRSNPDRFEPVSTNPAHEPIFPNSPVTVVGRVRRTLLEL
jgi:SOS-response transcriptional repressor LexA